MLNLSIHSNVKQFEKSLSALAYQQLPFAISQAVNELAMLAVTAEQTHLSQVLDKPTPFTTRSVAMLKARKSDPTAIVFIKDIAAAYLEPYQVGGVNKLNSRGLNKPVDQPVNQYGNLPRNIIKRLYGRKDVFIGPVKTKAGIVYGVWQRSKTARGGRREGGYGTKGRMDRNTGSLTLLMRFGSAHPTQPILHFGETSRAVVAHAAPRIIGRALARAIASARH